MKIGDRETVLYFIAQPSADFVKNLEVVIYPVPKRESSIELLRLMPPRTHSYRFDYGSWSFGPAITATFSVCSTYHPELGRIGGRLSIGFGMDDLDTIYTDRMRKRA